MNRKVTQKIDMFGRVKTVCDNNIAVVNSVPKLSEYFEKLGRGIDNIKDLRQRLATNSTGYAEEKNEAKQSLSLSLSKVSAGLEAFASDQHNMVLHQQAKFSPSGFMGLRSADAVNFAEALLALAEANIASLAPYNVTPTDLTGVQALVQQLNQLNPVPVAQITTQKAIRKSMFESVQKTNDLLRTRMDAMVKTLRLSDPLFYDEYFFARKMRHPGLRHTNLPESTPETPAAKTAEAPPMSGIPTLPAEALVEKLAEEANGVEKGAA